MHRQDAGAHVVADARVVVATVVDARAVVVTVVVMRVVLVVVSCVVGGRVVAAVTAMFLQISPEMNDGMNVLSASTARLLTAATRTELPAIVTS